MPLTAMSFETIQVERKPIGLNKHELRDQNGRAERAFITLEGGDVRYRYDGGDPTASIGHILHSGCHLVVEGQNQLEAVKFIRTGNDDGILSVSYERK